MDPVLFTTIDTDTETPPLHREQQQISVPFLWEEKPGKPKQGWSSHAVLPLVSSSLPFPAKLVVSVPFDWEEKPGKPLQLDLVALPATYSKDDHSNTRKIDDIFGFKTDEKANWQSASETDGNDYGQVRGNTTLAKRTLTLQELMLLSRQLTCRMNRIETKKSAHPKEKLKRSVLACLPFTMTDEQ